MNFLRWSTGSQREGDQTSQQGLPTTRKEARVHGRFKVKSPVTLSWQDAAGKTKTLRARALDMSTVGARVESPEPLTPGSFTYLKAPELKLMGSAIVRHCIARGFGYRIGLEFRNPLHRSY